MKMIILASSLVFVPGVTNDQGPHFNLVWGNSSSSATPCTANGALQYNDGPPECNLIWYMNGINGL